MLLTNRHGYKVTKLQSGRNRNFAGYRWNYPTSILVYWIGTNGIIWLQNANCVPCRCYIVDDEAAVVISIDHVKGDVDRMMLKVKESRAFAALLRSGVFVRRRRTNGVERCLTGHEHRHKVSHVQLSLPRDAMHSAVYAVARCPSVCLSICPSHVSILLKRLNTSSNFFTIEYPRRCSFSLCRRGPP